VVERRSSKVLSLIDDGPVYHALASTFVELIRQHVLTIDIPKQNFLSPEFGTKFQRKVPLFLVMPEFLFSTVRWVKGSSRGKTSSIRSAASMELRLVTETQTDRRTQGHSYSTRASIASRGEIIYSHWDMREYLSSSRRRQLSRVHAGIHFTAEVRRHANKASPRRPARRHVPPVSATSGSRAATLISGFDFSMEFPIFVLQ